MVSRLSREVFSSMWCARSVGRLLNDQLGGTTRISYKGSSFYQLIFSICMDNIIVVRLKYLIIKLL